MLPTAGADRRRIAGRFDAAAVASVVPAATGRWLVLVRRAGVEPLVVTPRTGIGLRFRYRRAELGADRVCAAVGARQSHAGNVVIVDFGTAITVNAVSHGGTFIGGFIVPGPDAILATLAGSTAQLPRLRTFRPGRESALPRTTRNAIRSGVATLVVSSVGALIDRAAGELGRPCRVIATGGRARDFARLIPSIDLVEPDLALRGLNAILNRHRARR